MGLRATVGAFTAAAALCVAAPLHASPLSGITLPDGVKALAECPAHTASAAMMKHETLSTLSAPTCVVFLADHIDEAIARTLITPLEAQGWRRGFGGADGMAMERTRNGCTEVLMVGLFTEQSPTTARQVIGPGNRPVMAFATGAPLCEAPAP